MKITVLGSLNMDLVAKVEKSPRPGETIQGKDFQIYCGGKGANQAYAAAKLGGDVTMLGQVGKDDFGEKLIQNLYEIGINTKFVSVHSSKNTGTAMIEVDENGENRIIVISGANDIEESFVENHLNLISQADVLLLQLETPMKAVKKSLDQASKMKTTTILDPAPAKLIPDEWFSLLDFITPNLSELSTMTQTPLNQLISTEKIKEAAHNLLNKGVGNVIVKMGNKGALKVCHDDYFLCSADKVDAVDSTGAGDCFNGALACELSKGKTIDEALKFSVKAASQSVTKPGAQPSMPFREEL